MAKKRTPDDSKSDGRRSKESITVGDAAGYVGVSKEHMFKRIYSAGLDASTLRYDVKSQEFTASTSGGAKKVMYIVETPRGRSAYFTRRGALKHMRENPNLYQRLRGSATAVYMPTITGGRINLL